MKYEKEVKILEIDIDDAMKKLKEIGAEFRGKKEQKIYVYDIPTIYYRYLEICELLKSTNELVIATNIVKLKILLQELVDLIPDDELSDTRILPEPFDPRLAETVAKAVKDHI